MLKAYYYLTKPGIVYGNGLAALGGFFLAAKGDIHVGVLLAMIAGISLVIASACVVNNYIDRDIDRHMKRTKKRALVTGSISNRSALLFAAVLGLTGSASLFFFTNTLTLAAALIGFFFYVVVYGAWKRRSEYGTVVGSISGAIPPVVGYAAASNTIDAGALLLFLVMVCWQMPHFYAIAIFRSEEYKAAHIPVLPLVRGVKHTKVQILIYIILFTLASTLLTFSGYTGIAYLLVMIVLGTAWLQRGLRGFKVDDDNRWARKMFGFSLVVLLVFCGMISIDFLLP